MIVIRREREMGGENWEEGIIIGHNKKEGGLGGGRQLTSSRERKIEIRRFPPRLRTARTRHAVLTRSVYSRSGTNHTQQHNACDPTPISQAISTTRKLSLPGLWSQHGNFTHITMCIHSPARGLNLLKIMVACSQTT